MARTSDKAAHWAEVIRRYRLSDQAQAQFYRDKDISYHRLRWWLHQPRAKRAMEPSVARQTAGREQSRGCPSGQRSLASYPSGSSRPPPTWRPIARSRGRHLRSRYSWAAGAASPSAPGSTPTSSGEWSSPWNCPDAELATLRPHLPRGGPGGHEARVRRPGPDGDRGHPAGPALRSGVRLPQSEGGIGSRSTTGRATVSPSGTAGRSGARSASPPARATRQRSAPST